MPKLAGQAVFVVEPFVVVVTAIEALFRPLEGNSDEIAVIVISTSPYDPVNVTVYGPPAGEGLTVAVPEPSAAVVFAAGLAALFSLHIAGRGFSKRT